MIELYAWSTSNARKVAIALEEMSMPYVVRLIDISAGEQFAPGFTNRFPNAKIPAIVDRDNGLSLFESGAILIYLADKSGRFLAGDGAARWYAIQWLMWQMGGFGPILGQAAHFLHYKPDTSAYAATRFGNETARLYSVLDGVLARNQFVAGDYSIADMAIWPWATRFEHQKIDLTTYSNVLRWYREVATRPAVLRGYRVVDANAVPALP